MSEPALCHCLDGLEPDNLLAFLALLGLLRSLEEAKPDWRPRAGWDLRDDAPLRPFVLLREAATPEALCEAAAEGIAYFQKALLPFSWSKNKQGMANRTRIAASPRALRKLNKRAISALSAARLKGDAARARVWSIRCALSSSTICESTDEKGNMRLADSPLKLSSGQMAFVGAMFEAARTCNARDISMALLEPWKYESRGNSLRLSPSEARRYAYRANDPSPEGAKSELGATSLGALGMTHLTMVPHSRSPLLSSYTGTRREGTVKWPLWFEPCTLDAIVAMLSIMPTADRSRDRVGPQLWSAIASARRYVLDPDQGDYGNVTLGKYTWAKAE